MPSTAVPPKIKPSHAGVTARGEFFGHYPNGNPVRRFTLSNAHGVRVELIEHGAALTRVELPDRNGVSADVAVGCDTWPDWWENTSHFGATVGRYGNRIAGASFSLDGATHQLPVNNAPVGFICHLHGGDTGFARRWWRGRIVKKNGAVGVAFTYESAAGEEGYPGKLSARVAYWLTSSNELRITFTARTDRTTIVNLINHAYWNLTGNFSGTIDEHQLQLAAEAFLPVTLGLIPTGERRSVAGTPFDFRRPKTIGADLHTKDPQLQRAGGYDHCFLLGETKALRFAARARDPASGRAFELWTDQPGVQFYTGNHFDGKITGKSGAPLASHAGFCLETGNLPDAPNRPDFPSPILRPGERYSHRMVFRFLAPNS